MRMCLWPASVFAACDSSPKHVDIFHVHAIVATRIHSKDWEFVYYALPGPFVIMQFKENHTQFSLEYLPDEQAWLSAAHAWKWVCSPHWTQNIVGLIWGEPPCRIRFLFYYTTRMFCHYYVLLQLLDAWVHTSMIHMKSCVYIYTLDSREKNMFICI